jgi:addiction module HigA family antidote
MRFDELPKHRPPTAGDHLRLEIEDLGVTQQRMADALGIARHRLNEIVNGKRRITPDTAMRLARVLDTSAELWLRFQEAIDLWDALHAPAAKRIAKLKPLRKADAA